MMMMSMMSKLEWFGYKVAKKDMFSCFKTAHKASVKDR